MSSSKTESPWSKIDQEIKTDRFRLFCPVPGCDLSILNVINGRLHLTTVHNNKRHSYSLTERDMDFILAQYIMSIPPERREALLSFLINMNP